MHGLIMRQTSLWLPCSLLLALHCGPSEPEEPGLADDGGRAPTRDGGSLDAAEVDPGDAAVGPDADGPDADGRDAAAGPPRDLPEPPEDLRDTELGRLAASLEPGEFGRLAEEVEGGGTIRAFLRVPLVGRSGTIAIDTWADTGYWDPIRKRTFFLGHRQNKKLISYWAADNTWREVHCWDLDPAPARYERFGHPYGRITYDYRRGHYYHYEGGRFWQFSVDDHQWALVSESSVGQRESPLEWHETLGGLVTVVRGHAWAFDGTEWRDLGASAVDGYHSSARYNEVRGDLLAIGGNHSRSDVTLIDAEGLISTRAVAPFEFGISGDNLTYDPLTGNYLVLEARRLWEYDPDLDEWRLAEDWTEGGWPFGPYGGKVPHPIDELGVIFWQYEGGTRLHRHRSAF